MSVGVVLAVLVLTPVMRMVRSDWRWYKAKLEATERKGKPVQW